MSHSSEDILQYPNTALQDTAQLDARYEITVLKLRECALHQPGHDLVKDAEIEALENELMFAQEVILEQIANLKVETAQDFKMIRNVWSAASNFKHITKLDPVDRITQSLYQYVESVA